ncbi:lipoprotein and hemagglutinin (VlhA) family protein, partial [Mycoplasmoides gallisepticum]
MSKKRIILKTISLLGTTSSLSIGISSCMSITKKDANPNNSQTQLQTARMELTDLINAKAMTLASLQDYAKIEASLSSAYSEAETVNNNLNATLEQLNMAKTNLESAINQANTDKTTFDNEHPNLVEAYKTLKTTLSQRATNLEGLASTAYNQIRNNLVDLYNKASSLITKTLDPLNGGTLLDSNEITTANKNINNTLSTINEQKTNANALANSFIKEVIQNNKQSFVGMFTNTNVQPSNYSFVAFSADVTPVNYKYARRTVW